MGNMAIKIKFDSQHNAETPTLVLATKNGKRIGKLPATNIQFKDTLNSYSELRFDIYKEDCNNRESYTLWEQVQDFKLVWVRDWNIFFEIYVELNESDETVKNISAKSLGEAELSQIKLYDIEINTETDIEREDYEPTKLFDEKDVNASLLNRIMEKAPHYSIKHVDSSISKIKKTFTFDNTTIYDAFQEIAQEIDCLFIIDCGINENWEIIREISVYDLETYCLDCQTRGNFSKECSECNSENVKIGYGKDTSIFISTDNLADDITYSTDNGSVKNCFRLEAGDDLMTATLINCNPNGSGYIWYISDEMKKDMSAELVSALSNYDKQYDYYYNDYTSIIDNSALAAFYNLIIIKYNEICSSNYPSISTEIKGYPALMQELYNVIDFYWFLKDGLMPGVSNSSTTAAKEVSKLTAAALSPVAVQNIDTCSDETVKNSVIAMAKVFVDSGYKVEVQNTSFKTFSPENASKYGTWKGNFKLTNYSDETDTATSSVVTIKITDTYKDYVKQKIEKTLNNKNSDLDIIALFELDEDEFEQELQKYCLTRLISFSDSCQSCLDVLIEQGVADKDMWAAQGSGEGTEDDSEDDSNEDSDLYTAIYVPYYNKLKLIQEQISVRKDEIALIIGRYDRYGYMVYPGIQSLLEKERDKIQNKLDFKKNLGEKLWLEFSAYRREDVYQNSNYISDGLTNAELFQNALEFIETAKKEIYKSATLQHSISASLKNLLVMKEFEPIVDNFEVGNWLRCKVDNKLNLLRLISYEINYSNLENISVTFSDVKKVKDGISDIESVLNQATSMATSYDAVIRQAEKGIESNRRISEWVNKGLELTKMKIIDDADNQNITWDSHGLLCKEYLPITDDYDDRQLKIINRGLYLTDDNWETSRTGIGNFTFYNPETLKFEESYGVIADTLVGNLILSETVGIYNEQNCVVIDSNGITITADTTDSAVSQTLFSIQRKEHVLEAGSTNGYDVYTPVMYIDSDGEIVLSGTVKIYTPDNSDSDKLPTLNEITNPNRYETFINNKFETELRGEGGVYSKLDANYQASIEFANSILNDYKADIGQYITHDENGLTLGATSSNFSTVIDNTGMYFKDGGVVVSYVNNQQLYIPHAVFEKSFVMGNYLFSVKENGGFSISWHKSV